MCTGLVEIWEDRKSYYMFMELCSGGELFHAISERCVSFLQAPSWTPRSMSLKDICMAISLVLGHLCNQHTCSLILWGLPKLWAAEGAEACSCSGCGGYIRMNGYPQAKSLRYNLVSCVALAMEVKPGLVHRRGSLSEREAASVLKVVLQVIQHCHSNGITHRDIKPENFMMKV